MKAPLVSICIPAYNHATYVRECIESVMVQDYQNIELLVIDDGSTDDTWDRIQELRERCEQRFVRVVMRTRENRGRAKTFAELFGEVRGELYGDIASDDRYLPGAISRLVRIFCDDEGVGLAVGRNRLIDASGRRCFWDADRQIVYDRSAARYESLDDLIEEGAGFDLSGADFGSYRRLCSGNHVPNGALKKVAFVRRVRAFDDRAPLEDLWFHLQLSKVARYAYLPEDVFEYRWHGVNCSQDLLTLWRDERTTLLLEEKLSGIRNTSLRGLVVKYVPTPIRLLVRRVRHSVRRR